MSLFTKLANAIFSPVDASGAPRPVQNIDVQVWGTEVERILAVFQAGGGIVFPDLSTANASLAYNANQMAWVMGDPTPANNGVYRKIGASGTGSWARMGDLPFSMIRLDNAGAGTVDAIVATPMLPLPTTPGAALLTVNILAANTGNVTLNGKPLRANSGNEIAPGGLTAGSIHAFLDLGSEYRLLSDQASAAVLSGAEAARDDALAAAAAISTAPQWAFADKASVLLFEPPVAPAFISVDGNLYDNAVSAPAHDGYVEDGDGNFYVLRRSPAVYLEAFRDDLDLDGPGDSSAGIAKAIGMLREIGGGRLILPTEAEINGLWDIDFGRVDIDFNGCLLRAPDGASAIVDAFGDVSSTAYELVGAAAKGDMSLQCTTTVSGIAAGDIIKVEDDSARLTDSSTQINVELLKVASVSGDTIHLAEPLNRSKTVWSGNIRRVDLLNNVVLRNGRTAALDVATGNAGLMLRYLGDGSIVDWISHENGVGDALSLRSCWGVDYNLRHAKPAQFINSGQGYAVSIIRGSRFCDGAVYGEGQRHTFDYDSSWDCRARVKSVGEKSGIVWSHNGAGGRLSLDVNMVESNTTASITSATWKDITGNGAYNDDDNVFEGLRIRATVHQQRNVSHEYGLIANAALRDCDIDIRAVLGDGGSYSANGNSAAVRLYPNGNTGRVRVYSRGYSRGFMALSGTALSTTQGKGVKVDIDVDWASYGAFYQYADEVNLGRFVVGPNISTKVLYCFSNATAKLYGFQIDDMTCAVGDLTKYEDINATGIGDYTKGAIGRVTSPFATFAATGNFQITQNMMLAAGKVIAMALGGNSTLTGIEDGLFEGHTLVILRRGSGTLTVADISSQLILKTSPQNITTLMIVWQDGMWWEV